MTQEDWNKSVPYKNEQGWLLSHAGLTYETRYANVASGLAVVKQGGVSRIFGAGWSRGGEYPVGGITWLDWYDEFEPISDYKQIVGHSRGKVPREKLGNWCLDTDLRHYGLITDGELSIHEVV